MTKEICEFNYIIHQCPLSLINLVLQINPLFPLQCVDFMDDGKPSFWYFQMVGVTILLIGGSISGIILVIGLEQEGSWVIFKVGGMLLCLTFILSNIAQIRYLSRLADWQTENNKSNIYAKFRMSVNSLSVMFFAIFALLIPFIGI